MAIILPFIDAINIVPLYIVPPAQPRDMAPVQDVRTNVLESMIANMPKMNFCLIFTLIFAPT
jgi:hypothetical protein